MEQKGTSPILVFRTIRTRLTFSHLAVIIVAMGLSGLLLLSLLEGYFVSAMEDSLVAQARITAQALIPGARTEGPPVDVSAAAYNTLQQQSLSNLSLQTQNLAVPTGEIQLGELADTTFQLSSQLDTRIRIVDAQGVVLVDSQRGSQGEDLSGDPLVAQALAGEYASPSAPAGGAQQMHIAVPVLVEGKLVGAVYLSQSLRDITAVMRDLRLRWLLATTIALGLSGVVGLLLSGAISRPLRRLTAAAGAVAEGELDQQVPVGTGDELGQLSQAFNEMTARLRAARQMQVDFVANVSHELRTPLTAIKGLVETLRDGAVDDTEVRDHFLETVEDETDRLIRLVNDLMILSRADSDALNLQREPVDLGILAEATIARLTPWASERDITQRAVVRPDTPLALIDSDRMEQVLVNLLDNAIKFSQPGGSVVVTLKSGRDRTVLVQVQDQGVGIPAEALSRIGERFYRADRARSRTEGGSGLGLAIARALVEAHGGCLWVESEEGQGTVVAFAVPLARS
jgi:two-component system sensor histidine kinase BaeS